MKTVFTLIILLIVFNQSFAQPGTLDKSFGNAGKVVSQNYNGAAYASLIQPDGKILIGGSGTYYKNNVLTGGSLLARYNTDGSLDVSFADSGRGIYILGDTGIYIPTIKALALQPDGKIVALGNVGEQNGFIGFLALMRFNADGTTDKSFGIKGLTVSQISAGIDYPHDMALLPDGRIVVVGDSYKDFYSFENSFIACYTPDGKFDRSFGDTGIIKISPEIGGKLSSVVITGNGKIVTGGFGPGYEIVFRYNNDGTLDSSFGENGLGKMFFENSDNPSFNDIALDKEGRIITGGSNILSKRRAIMIGRFTEDGKTDNSFSDDGYTYTAYNKGDAYCNTVAVQEDGKIIAGGFHSVNETGTFTVIRYKTDGRVDSSFGESGTQNTFFYGDDGAYSVNIQKDGKIILAGYSQVPAPEYNIVDIVRYNNDSTKKQIIITKIKHWIQHHNGIEWNRYNNIGSYVVQRSYDGIHFKSIARINANNNSDYTYNDASPLSGTNYYRLQATSVTGDINYSNVIAITNNNLKLSPNPATNYLHIEGLPSSNLKLTVVDFAGNIALSVKLSAFSTSYNLNIASLKQGNYLLKIETNDEVVTKQFVKE